MTRPRLVSPLQPATNAIRVLLVEDHALVRAGLRSILSGVSGVAVVGEASDGRDALAQVERDPPDVALVDITMPGLNGIELTSRLSEIHPTVRILIVSMHGNEEYVARAIRSGADGYVLKDAGQADLVEGIRAVARGQRFLSKQISLAEVERYLEQDAPSRLDRLTPRQREVLQLVAEGSTTKEIAARLNISVKTVEVHRTHLMERLEIHDIAGLARFAVRHGMVSPDA